MALTKHLITTNRVDYSTIDRNVDLGPLEYCAENRVINLVHSAKAYPISGPKTREMLWLRRLEPQVNPIPCL